MKAVTTLASTFKTFVADLKREGHNLAWGFEKGYEHDVTSEGIPVTPESYEKLADSAEVRLAGSIIYLSAGNASRPIQRVFREWERKQLGKMSDDLEPRPLSNMSDLDNIILSEIDAVAARDSAAFDISLGANEAQEGRRVPWGNNPPTMSYEFRLERPGLFLMASRQQHPRRYGLAKLIIDTEVSVRADREHPGAAVGANGTSGGLVSEVLAISTNISPDGLRRVENPDILWPRLTAAVNWVTGNDGASDSAYKVGETQSYLLWKDGPFSEADAFRLLELANDGAVVVIENIHAVSGVSDVVRLLRDLRAEACKRDQYLYVGVGMNHWHEIRKEATGPLLLTDLEESCAGVIHFADKIALVRDVKNKREATIYDARSARRLTQDL